MGVGFSFLNCESSGTFLLEFEDTLKAHHFALFFFNIKIISAMWNDIMA